MLNWKKSPCFWETYQLRFRALEHRLGWNLRAMFSGPKGSVELLLTDVHSWLLPLTGRRQSGASPVSTPTKSLENLTQKAREMKGKAFADVWPSDTSRLVCFRPRLKTISLKYFCHLHLSFIRFSIKYLSSEGRSGSRLITKVSKKQGKLEWRGRHEEINRG